MQLPPALTTPVAALANQCAVCDKICRSAGGLKLHMKTHGVTAPTNSTSPLCCHLCHKLCKSLAGLKSHLRAHRGSTHTTIVQPDDVEEDTATV